MVEHPKSTKKEPLKFFIWLFSDNSLDHYRMLFLYPYCQVSDATMEGEDKVFFTMKAESESGAIFNYQDKHFMDFAKELSTKISLEFDNTKELINQAIADIAFQDNSSSRFLNLQLNILLEIKAKSKEYITRYPFIQKTLSEIEEFIITNKKQYEDCSTQQVTTSKEDHTEKKEVNEIIIYEKQQLINLIFGYLKGEYISTKEWERLMKYVNSFMQQYEIPFINPIFHIEKRYLPMMKYTFYILYYKLGDRNQDKFTEFYLRAFETEHPTEKEIKTISKKMAYKPKLPENFPQIKGVK